MIAREPKYLCTSVPLCNDEGAATRIPVPSLHRDSDTQETQETQDTHRDTPGSSASDERRVQAVSIWTLPLQKFVKHVLGELQGYDGVYPPAIFLFVRQVKGFYPEGKSADAAFDEVAPIVRKLGGWPTSFDGNEIDEEEAYAEFVTLWDKIRYRPDETPLTNAVVKAQAYPLGTLRSTGKRPLPGYNRFVSLAGWLQVSMGDRPIMLPCHDCARVLHSTPNMISIWRKWAIEDGFLKVVKEHTYHPRGKSEATLFRFDVSRWTCLAKVAQRGSKSSFEYAEFTPTEMLENR